MRYSKLSKTTKSILNFETYDVSLIRSTRRRHLALEINRDGIFARAPMRMSRKVIVEFIQKKHNWIHKHLGTLSPAPEQVTVTNISTVLLHGKLINFDIRAGQRGKPELSEQGLILPVLKSHLPFEVSAKTKLIKWYKKTALSQIQQRVDFYSQEMAVPSTKIKTLKVRDYKRRWGCLDTKGVLSFNWRIIMAPPEMLDYVVVHELAHYHEFNHSKRFWSIVEQQLPDWRQRSAWFQTNGGNLYQF